MNLSCSAVNVAHEGELRFGETAYLASKWREQLQMIKNFDEVKGQLTELVQIVNGFTSEQVQLRVVEALLANMVDTKLEVGGKPKEVVHGALATEGKPAASRKNSRRKSSNNGAIESKTGGSKKTPKKSIEGLISDGFFSQRRMISEVVNHLAEKRATTIPQATVQVTLNRLVQNGKMHRAKNENEQYEYWN